MISSALRKTALLLMTSLLLLNGCAKQDNARKPKPLPVESTTVQSGDMPIVVNTLGQAVAFHSVTITPQVSGILQRVFIHSGEQVQKGQRLFQIDPSTPAAQVAQDRANLQGEIAQEQYDKAQVEAYAPLLSKDYVTRQTVQQAQAQAGTASATVAADQAALQAAKITLAQTLIRAPIAGTVGILSIKSGNLVNANSTQLVTINQTQPMNVQFSLPETYLNDLHTAVTQHTGKVTVWDENHHHVIGHGLITAIDNTVNTASATVTARATLANHQSLLWPGEYVQVDFTARQLENVLIIPATALQQGVSGSFVYTIEKGKAVMQPVKFLGQDGQRVAIAAPHLLGQTIIVGAPTRLHPGSAVSITHS